MPGARNNRAAIPAIKLSRFMTWSSENLQDGKPRRVSSALGTPTPPTYPRASRGLANPSRDGLRWGKPSSVHTILRRAPPQKDSTPQVRVFCGLFRVPNVTLVLL